MEVGEQEDINILFSAILPFYYLTIIRLPRYSPHSPSIIPPINLLLTLLLAYVLSLQLL